MYVLGVKINLTKNLLLPLALFSIIFVSSCSSENTESSEASSEESSTPAEDQSIELTLCDQILAGYIVKLNQDQVELCETDSEYEVATGELNGLPSSEATFILSAYGIEKTQGATSLNHPASGASDGTHLAVADRFNNRVLIFNSLPSGQAEPDVVVGQKDFITNTPGTELNQLNWPGAVEITPDGKLLIADTENGRILIFNSIPTSNDTSADYELDLAALTGSYDAWPWGVWSDGKSLVVTDTRIGNILTWNNFPSDSSAKPDSISNPNGVGTPRNITSDGKSFLIGDENASQQSCWGAGNQNPQRQSHIWINRLPVGEPDACIYDWFQGDVINGGLIALSASGQDAHYWPDFPVSEETALNKFTTGSVPVQPQGAPQGEPQDPNQSPAPGQPQPQSVDPNQAPAPGQPQPQPQPQSKGSQPVEIDVKLVASMNSQSHSYLGGDGGDVVVAGSKVFFIEYNGNRITAWNEFSEELTGKVPDFSVFTEDANVSTLLRDGFMQNPILVNADGALVASSDYDSQVRVWNQAPATDSAMPDYVYQFGFQMWDNTYSDGVLAVGGKDQVVIWENFTPGSMPTKTFIQNIGSVQLQEVNGVAYDGTYFAVSDNRASKIYVFEGVPTETSTPIQELEVRGPGRIDMKDGVILVAPRESAEITKVDIKANSVKSIRLDVNLPNQVRFLPIGIAVADTSFHRVQIWTSANAFEAGSTADLILGGERGERPQTKSDRFYFPASVEQIGPYLLVGEFKFSNRVLGFTN